MRDAADFAREHHDRVGWGALRRMAISLTAKVLWQLAGFKMPDGSQETVNAEPFIGIGFFARPPTNGKPEAIVLPIGQPGGGQTLAVVAVRDEQTRQAVAGSLQADEAAMFNTQAIVYIKADGTIEARSANGVAVKLPTLADVAKIETAISGATVTPNDGGATLKATIVSGLASSLHGVAGTAPWPVGTTKLKAE